MSLIPTIDKRYGEYREQEVDYRVVASEQYRIRARVDKVRDLDLSAKVHRNLADMLDLDRIWIRGRAKR